MYLLDQDQEAENGYQKSLRCNHVMDHLVNLQQNETLEVKRQFHQERLPVFHIQQQSTALCNHFKVLEKIFLNDQKIYQTGRTEWSRKFSKHQIIQVVKNQSISPEGSKNYGRTESSYAFKKMNELICYRCIKIKAPLTPYLLTEPLTNRKAVEINTGM